MAYTCRYGKPCWSINISITVAEAAERSHGLMYFQDINILERTHENFT